ncbi:MAG: TonB-dependent receptor [Cyclobacteriaceae bacterium]
MKKHYLDRIGFKRPFFLTLLLILICSFSTFAQNITGKVVFIDGNESIPGATILLKDTNRGAISDIDGNFSIDVYGVENPVLVISFVGFITQEVSVNNRSYIEVALEADVQALEEVVVIGYGTQQKKVVTAATAQVKGDQLVKRNTTRALQALQGQAAGVNIRSSSGQPGEGLRVNIRGLGTTGNAGPLYIVDGVATGDISYLNNSDIVSIDVLKDAASAAIYGSRAANGVILVTTKKGKSGKTQVSFDSYYGIQNSPKELKMLDSKEYAIIMNEQHLNSGGTVAGLPFDLSNLPAYTSSGAANTDWLSEMFSPNAVMQNYAAGITGGNDNTTFSMSFSYTDQEGIVGGKEQSYYERYNARLTLENKLFDDKLVIGNNATFSYSNKNGIRVGNQYDNSLRGAFNTSPLLPINNDYGRYFNTADTITDQNGATYWNNTESSPYANMLLNNQNKQNNQKLFGNVYADFSPIDNLKFHSSFGYDLFNGEYRSYSPIYQLSVYAIRAKSSANQSMNRGSAIQYDNWAEYNLLQNDNQFNIMLGMSSRIFKGSYISGANADVIFPEFNKAYLSNTTNQEINLISLSGAPFDEEKILSFFSRIQYFIKDKYLFNATVRADGSSRFAEGNRWGFFPSLSGGWVLSDEQFLQGISWIDFLKLRASWGQNGNQNIPAFQYLAPISFSNATYAFGSEEGVNTPGAYPSRLAFEALQWETSEQINVGIDTRFIGGSVLVTLDFYKKSTKDWLITAPVLATAGANPPVINGGLIENSGIELELSYSAYKGDLSYKINANGSVNKNLVKEVPTEDGIIHGASNTLYANSSEFYRAQSGFPIGYFWGMETDGLFQNSADVDAHTTSDGQLIQPNAKPGDVKFIDQNDDGALNDLDKVQLGNPNPIASIGLNFSADFRGFDFSINTYGAFGHQIVQSYRDHSNKFANYTTAILDRWSGEGTSERIPRVTNSNTNYYHFSDLFIENGNFLRIANLTLGYDLTEIVRNKNINQLRFYLAVNNLATLTKYSGMDPDVGYGFDNGIQDKFSSGVDLGFYPNPRSILIGTSFKF